MHVLPEEVELVAFHEGVSYFCAFCLHILKLAKSLPKISRTPTVCGFRGKHVKSTLVGEFPLLEGEVLGDLGVESLQMLSRRGSKQEDTSGNDDGG